MLSIFKLYGYLLILVSSSLKVGAEISQASTNSASDVHLLHAAAQGNLAELKRAIRAGANLNVIDPESGNSPLLWASFTGQLEAIKLLLNAGANLEVESSDGRKTALLMASYAGHVEIVKLLLTHGANVDAKNSRGDTSLHISSYIGRLDIVNILLQKSTQINLQTDRTGYAAIHFASFKGNFEIVEILLNAGADVSIKDASGKTAIMLSCMQKYPSIVKLLVHSANSRDGAEDSFTDFNSQSLLNEPSLNSVTKETAIVNYQDGLGYTALMLAVRAGCIDCIHALVLDGRCALELKNKDQQTALMIAVSIGQNDAIKTLVMYGAEIHQ